MQLSSFAVSGQRAHTSKAGQTKPHKLPVSRSIPWTLTSKAHSSSHIHSRREDALCNQQLCSQPSEHVHNFTNSYLDTGKVSHQHNLHLEELKVSGERNGDLWSCKRLPDLGFGFLILQNNFSHCSQNMLKFLKIQPQGDIWHGMCQTVRIWQH